jgi:hypothetical protein
MRSIAVLLAMTLAACSPEAEVTDSTNKCVTELYPSYNSKRLDQCMDACLKCKRGNMATCSTSCTLNGAR